MLNEIIKHCPREILPFLKKKHYEKGDIIIQQQNDNNYVYFLISGRVKAYYISPIGTECTVLSLTEPNVLGEVEILKKIKAPSMVQAETDCEIFMLKKDKFLEWLKKDFSFSLFFMELLVNKLSLLSKLSYSRINRTVDQRLLYVLQVAIIKNQFVLSRGELQRQLFTTSRSANRSIKKLSDSCLISVEKNIIKIKDMEKLKKYIESKIY